MVSLVHVHPNAASRRWHLWEIYLRFASGLPPRWWLKWFPLAQVMLSSGQGVAIAAGSVPFDITVTVQASEPDGEREKEREIQREGEREKESKRAK